MEAPPSSRPAQAARSPGRSGHLVDGGRPTWVEAIRRHPYCPPVDLRRIEPGSLPRSVIPMDLTIHRPHATCARTGRQFVAGEPFFSALVRAQGKLERQDFAVTAWDGPPDDTLAWWRSTFPATTTAGAALAPVEVLLDVVEQLEGSADDDALRYLLSLELVRRRVLRFVDHPGPAAGEDPASGDADAAQHVVLACRRRDREYRVRVVSAAEAGATGVEERLTTLLWSGGDA